MTKYPAAPRVFGTREPALTRYLMQDGQHRQDVALLKCVDAYELLARDLERADTRTYGKRGKKP